MGEGADGGAGPARPAGKRRGRKPSPVPPGGPRSGIDRLEELERENAALRQLLADYVASDGAAGPLIGDQP